MASTYVALDIEMTGLNSERDDIIEVAAVRFAGGRVLDAYTSLVRPEAALPLSVTHMTGLTAADLAAAPPIEAVLAPLEAFVGDAPVVGHSVGLDLRFLRRHGALLAQQAVDTHELASILVPDASRFGLAPLAACFGIAVPDHHRALADAHTSRLLFEALVERARRLEPGLLDAILALAERVDWPLGTVFRDAAAARLPADPPRARRAPPEPLVAAPGRPTIDVDALERLVAPGGALDARMPGFEDRPGQREMLRRVAEAFERGDQLLVEAGTGTGKSLAYLVPAGAWAVAAGRPVVVSTHTLNLQDQLHGKDLPLVAELLGGGLVATTLKGRANYLCRTRLAGVLARDDLTDLDTVRALAKILVWSHLTETGDGTELTLQPAEERAWRLVSAEGDACTPERCGYARSGECWVHRARARAEGAHIVVVNHALLVSDLLVDNRLLPRHGHLVVDEAHHLEDVATSALGFRAGEARARDALAALEAGGRGALHRALVAVEASGLPDEAREALGDAIRGLQENVVAAAPAAGSLFGFVAEFLAEQTGTRTGDVRLTEAARGSPGWLAVEMAWDDLHGRLKDVRAGVSRLIQALVATEGDLSSDPSLVPDLAAALRDLGELDDGLERVIARPSPAEVMWASRAHERASLHAAPLHVGDTLSRRLFADKEALVLTSATLRAGDGFDFLRDRLALPDAPAVVIPSPFDFAAQALVYVPTDMPEPNQPDYQRALNEALVALGGALKGRTLVLFTSHSGLQAAYHGIRAPLARAGVAVLGQGLDGGRRGLLERFRDPEMPTMLLGTRSFWEGVDVPGDALACLAVTRLPFDVPADPVFAARSETFEEPFEDYAVPLAVLRFRQGFGRLIRSGSDRGVVVVFDSRVSSKRYGSGFLDALPPCRRHVGPLHALPEAARRFVAGEADLAEAAFSLGEVEPLPTSPHHRHGGDPYD